MESSSSAKPSVPPPNPLSTFFHCVGAQPATRLDDAKRFAGANFQALLPPPPPQLF
ncbi:hypothetical protein OROGR_029157 [Orobanche gracilis]